MKAYGQDELSVKEAADLLHVSEQTLRRMEEDGRLVPSRTQGGHRRYAKQKVMRLIETDPIQTYKYHESYFSVVRLPDGSIQEEDCQVNEIEVETKYRQEIYRNLCQIGEPVISGFPTPDDVPLSEMKNLDGLQLYNYRLANGENACCYNLSIKALSEKEVRLAQKTLIPLLAKKLESVKPIQGVIYWQTENNIPGLFSESMGEWVPEAGNTSLQQYK